MDRILVADGSMLEALFRKLDSLAEKSIWRSLRIASSCFRKLVEKSKRQIVSIPARWVFFQDDHKQCTCSMGRVQSYQKRISGPLVTPHRHSRGCAARAL